MFVLIFLIPLLMFCDLGFAQNTTYILIHGTWSRKVSWYQEGGNFYDSLYSVLEDGDEIISFSWSGALAEGARNEAAELLVSLVEAINTADIVLVGHSHGGNVALTAVRLLDQKNQKKHIKAIILLGTPQYYHNKVPENVDFIFNLFSFGDMIQPVFNMFRREVPESLKTANLAILLENREPDHHLLYHPLIGFYLPDLIRLSDDQKNKITQYPYVVSFSWRDGFCIISDIDRKDRIKQDLFKQERLLTYMLWGPSELLYFYP